MIFGTDKRISKLENTTLNIQHNGIVINNTKSYKYLGIKLTNSLNMTDHLNATIKKASSRLHLLRKMRHYMDTKTAHLIHQSMIVPILTYCSLTLFGETPPYIKLKIEALENRAKSIIVIIKEL